MVDWKAREYRKCTVLQAPAGKHKHPLHSGPWWGIVISCRDDAKTDRKGGPQFEVWWEEGFKSNETEATVKKLAVNAPGSEKMPVCIKMRLSKMVGTRRSASGEATAVTSDEHAAGSEPGKVHADATDGTEHQDPGNNGDGVTDEPHAGACWKVPHPFLR